MLIQSCSDLKQSGNRAITNYNMKRLTDSHFISQDRLLSHVKPTKTQTCGNCERWETSERKCPPSRCTYGNGKIKVMCRKCAGLQAFRLTRQTLQPCKNSESICSVAVRSQWRQHCPCSCPYTWESCFCLIWILLLREGSDWQESGLMISLEGLSWARLLAPAATPWLKRKGKTQTLHFFLCLQYSLPHRMGKPQDK